MRKLLLLSAILWLTGCATGSYVNQAEHFQERGGEAAAGYEMLAPVSVEAMEYFFAEQHGAVEAFLDGIEERIHDTVELQRFLRDAREINEQSRLDADPEWRNFVGRLRSGDELYLFEYRRRFYNDFGLLVLRDGKVVFRTVWDSAWPAGLEAEQITEPEIDRL